MSRSSLPVNIRSVSELEHKMKIIANQLESDLIYEFSQEIENLFKDKHILIRFQDKVELSMFDKETDRVEEIFSYSMDKGEITLGKAPSNDIVIIERYISREHAFFKLTDKGVFLTDNGSTNGTYINGVKMNPNDPQQLNNEDILHFGAQKIKFCIKKEASDDIRLKSSCSVSIERNSPIIKPIYKSPIMICRFIKSNKKVIFETDRYFFYDIINSLLGFGETEGFVYEKPVTEIEEGVFLYLFALVLDKINRILIPEEDILVFEKKGTGDDLIISGEYLQLGLCINANRNKYGIRIYIEGDSLGIKSSVNNGFRPEILGILSAEPVSLDLHAGKASLSYDELKSINNQSILIIDKWYLNSRTPQADDVIVVSQPDTGICFRGRVSDNKSKFQVIIDQIFKKENLSMDEFDTEKDKVIGNLDTEIYVVLASKKIALSELSKIKKGDILDFEGKIDNKVSLVVNKSVFAKGELIEYEGKIGVEITDVLY